MRCKLWLLSLGLSPGLVCAQQVQDLSPAAAPHFNVVKGSDDPSAVSIDVATVTVLRGSYERERFNAEGYGSVDRFARRYSTDRVLADKMVTAIRRVGGEIDAHIAAQKQSFCARSFSNDSDWKAAMIEIEDDKSAFVAAFNELREVAGVELWKRIVLDADEARKSMTIVRTNFDSAVAEFGYETLFANQCKNQ
jgi:hypothetical protein